MVAGMVLHPKLRASAPVGPKPTAPAMQPAVWALASPLHAGRSAISRTRCLTDHCTSSDFHQSGTPGGTPLLSVQFARCHSLGRSHLAYLSRQPRANAPGPFATYSLPSTAPVRVGRLQEPMWRRTIGSQVGETTLSVRQYITTSRHRQSKGSLSTAETDLLPELHKGSWLRRPTSGHAHSGGRSDDYRVALPTDCRVVLREPLLRERTRCILLSTESRVL